MKRKDIKIKFKSKKFFVEDFKDFDFLESKGFGFRFEESLLISEFEALYLLETNTIQIFNYKNEVLEFDDVVSKLKVNLDEFVVFKDLKSKGYVIRTGAKFGTTFRVYKGKNETNHSLWIVNVVKENEKIEFVNVLAKNRVAHSTNKKLIFAIVDRDFGITYVENSWVKF